MIDFAVYVGAGLDIVPILVLRHIKQFIYIDSQPFSEFGTHVYTNKYESFDATVNTRQNHEENNLFGRPTFKERFEQLMKQNNFIVQSETKYCWIYKNDYGQVIKYHVSCAFPEFLTEEIKKDISECNTLILCGHFPNNRILSLMYEPKYIICNCHTVYTYDADEKDSSVIKYLLDNQHIPEKYFLLKEYKKYDYWEHTNIVEDIRDNYNVIPCNTLDDVIKNIN